MSKGDDEPEPHDGTHNGGSQAAGEDVANDAVGPRPERPADANVARLPAHAVRQHAVETDGGQHERQHREAAEQRTGKAALPDSVRDATVVGLHVQE